MLIEIDFNSDEALYTAQESDHYGNCHFDDS